MQFALIGCGVYSLGISKIIKDNIKIKMWVHDETIIPSLPKESNITYSNNLDEIKNDVSAIFILVSSNFYKDIINNLKDNLNHDIPIYIGTKGMINDETLINYTKKIIPNPLFFFAGPTFANDLMKNTPASFTLSSKDNNLFNNITLNNILIDYATSEVLLELSSIYKNIIAIGSGMIMGLTNSYSTLLTYLTKAYQEFVIIDKTANYFSYGTLGDYFLTTTSSSSRNYNYGKLLIENNVNDYLLKNTVEGYNMLPNFYKYLQNNSYNITIINIIYQIIYENKDPKTILEYLKRTE